METQTLSASTINQETFEDLYKNHLEAIQSVVKGFRIQDASANDVVQNIFMAAWAKRDSLREVAAFSGWLMQIARNACAQEVQRQKRFVSLSSENGFAADDDADYNLYLAANNEDEALELEILLALIRKAIATHENKVRATVAHLFYIDERSVAEIASIMDTNVNTILSHLRRFRLILATSMQSLVENNDLTLESTYSRLLRA